MIYKYIGQNVETRFDNSSYELNRPLCKRENKTLIGLIKDELDGKIMRNLV